ncbi:MAG: cytochrome c [Paracoccaceae bacterium]|nr:cytochrome c [Paracoccaceae bacterium]
MNHPSLKLAAVLSCLMLAPFAAVADDAGLDPIAAAGKVIFEETAGGVGCQTCHGPEAKGDVGPDIRGRTSKDILTQLKNNTNMQFIKLTKDEVDQVATYLLYLHDLEAH